MLTAASDLKNEEFQGEMPELQRSEDKEIRAGAASDAEQWFSLRTPLPTALHALLLGKNECLLSLAERIFSVDYFD